MKIVARTQILKIRLVCTHKNIEFAQFFPCCDILPFLSSLSIGNEESDVECLRKAGMSGVPADACVVAQKAAGYICKSNGGCGAVREFAEHIFLLLEKVTSARKQLEEINSAVKETGK